MSAWIVGFMNNQRRAFIHNDSLGPTGIPRYDLEMCVVYLTSIDTGVFLLIDSLSS